MRDHIEEGYKSHRIEGEGSFLILGLGFDRRRVLLHSWW